MPVIRWLLDGPLKGFPDLPPVAGLRMATAAAGVRYRGRTDLMLAVPPGSLRDFVRASKKP